MSSVKQVILYGLLIKTPETGSVYGAGVTLSAATDGVLLGRECVMEINYAEGGDRIAAPGSAAASLRKAPPSGPFVTTTPRFEVRGAGAAYSGSVFPLDIHTLMQISGHSATFGTTWIYAPISTAWASAGAEAYSRGQKWVLNGVYCDFSFLIENPGISFFEFPLSGRLAADPTDVALPAIALNGTVIPPKANNLTFSIHGVTTTRVRRIVGRKNQVITPRLDVNQGGHAGFGMGRRMLTLEVEIEATAIATLNPYTLWSAATALSSLSWTVGSAATNRWKFAAAQAYITNVREGGDDVTATWILTIVCTPSTPSANDDYTITFD